MLKVLRENLKSLSWILWLVVLVFVLLVFVDFGSAVPTRGAPTDTAITVGSEEISFDEFRRQLDRTRRFYQNLYQDNFGPDLERQLGIPNQALNTLITDRILSLEAKRMGIRVSDSEVRDAIVQQFTDEQDRFVGEERYKEILRSNRLTPTQFENDLRADLATIKLQSILTDNVYVSESEVEKAYREQVERAKIEFVQLRPDLFADDVSVDDAEVQAHYDANQNDFRLPERRSVRYLLVDREEVAATLELSDEELQAYYSLNAADYERQEEVRARHILLKKGADRTIEVAKAEIEALKARIEGGEDFAELAKELSEDVVSGRDGGDLNFFSRGAMVKPFEDAAFAGQPGDLIGPVETGFGVHLIEVLERRPGGATPFEDVREQIRARVAAERSATLAETRANELVERLRQEDALSEEAQQAIANETPGARLLVTPAFGRDDSVPGIGRAQPFSVAAFELEEGGVSDPVETRNGWAILTLTEVLAPEIPPLEEVEGDVRRIVQKSKRMAEAGVQAAADLAQLKAGETLADIAEARGLVVQESPLFGRNGRVGPLGSAPAVAEEALALDVDEFGGPVSLDDSVVLFRVTERQKFDPVEYAEGKTSTRERVVRQKSNRVLSSLIEKRREELGVTLSTTLARDLDPEATEEG